MDNGVIESPKHKRKMSTSRESESREKEIVRENRQRERVNFVGAQRCFACVAGARFLCVTNPAMWAFLGTLDINTVKIAEKRRHRIDFEKCWQHKVGLSRCRYCCCSGQRYLARCIKISFLSKVLDRHSLFSSKN